MEADKQGFFAARWRGAVEPGRLFFIDMVVVATAINVVMGFVAILGLGFKWPSWLVGAVYLSPFPYNLFLVICLWRTLDLRQVRAAAAWRIGALLWLLAATLL